MGKVTINLIVSFLFSGSLLMAQEMDQNVISNGGEDYSNSEVQMNITIGEAIVITEEGENSTFTQGFNQPDSLVSETNQDNIVWAASIFSPNGDDNNDVFYVRGQSISSVSFKIFNRWGQLVFQAASISEGWDGTYAGKEADEGVYFYSITVTFEDSEMSHLKGDLTLVR